MPAGAACEERLGEVDVPTLIVVGDEDLPDMAEIARDPRRRDRRRPRSRRSSGAGHLPSLERPDELNRLLLDFLQ